MIRLEDRRSVALDIEQAHAAGARLKLACNLAGINVRTLQRWKAGAGLVQGDKRPLAVRPIPAHALSQDERAQIVNVANEPRFASMPPARIVPMLADEGVYLASESSFSRVLQAHGQVRHRGRAKTAQDCCSPTDHAYRHCASSGVVLGHDVFTCRGTGLLVSSLLDSGSVQQKNRGLGGA